MKCKNCHSEISESSEYCPNCGAKIVRNRITLKTLFNDFLNNYVGWDNKFFKTLINLIIKPHIVVSEYLDGVRKRYVAPLVFVAFGAALSMILFNSYSEVYLETSQNVNNLQFEFIMEMSGIDIENDEVYAKEYEKMNKNTEESQKMILKYFNIFTFLLLPFYALISFLVFGWKKITYGEHLVINCYIQGLSFFFTISLFIIGLFTSPKILYFTLLINIFYYLFVYGKLLKLSFLNIILKILKFMLVILGFFLIIIISGIIVGILIAILSKT